MTLPSAVIYVVAAVDLISTTLLSLQLDPIPVVHKPHPPTSQAGFFASLHQKIKSGPLSSSPVSSSSSSKPASGITAHRLLLFVYLVCLARCVTLFVAGFGLSRARSASTMRGTNRNGSSSSGGVVRQTQTGPLIVAAVCFSSLAANTFVLNLLFQARPARVTFIGTELTISGLVSGQVILSLLEWVLFVLVVGRGGGGATTTTGDSASSGMPVSEAPTQDVPATTEGAYEINDANLVTDTRPDNEQSPTLTTTTRTSPKSIVAHATQASEDLKGIASASGSPEKTTASTGNYGTFTAGTSTSPSAAAAAATAAAATTTSSATSAPEAKDGVVSDANEAIKSEPAKASTSATQAQTNPSSSSAISSSPSAKPSSSAEPTLVGTDDGKRKDKGHERQDTQDAASQDIVDISNDRDASKQQARQRLDNARQKGNSRRRSIWEKVRRKSKVPSSAAEGGE